MAGTFSSFNTALSALRHTQVVMDVASGNVANVGTAGYTRRRAEAETVGAPSRAALWSVSQLSADGVRTSGVTRMSDALLDVRARQQHSSQSYLDVRQGVLERVETGIGEPGDNGLAAAIADYRTAWHDLANNPGSAATRGQLLAKAGTVTQAFSLQVTNLENEASDQRAKLLTLVTEVRTTARDLAGINTSLAAATLSGTDTQTLLDTRDRLAMRLSELVGAVSTGRPDGGFDTTVNGVPLVTGGTAGDLTISTGVTPTGAPDGNPVTFTVIDGAGTTAVPAGMQGEIGAVSELLTTTLPAYVSALDAIAASFADGANTLHSAGYESGGAPGGPLFAYTPGQAAGSLTVAVTDIARLAISSTAGASLDTGNADLLAASTPAEDSYQQLVNGFGTEVASVRRLALTQSTLTQQVDGSREQLSGVSLDEETLTMVTAQHAYEAAARVMTTLDSVLDTLINRTGLTH